MSLPPVSPGRITSIWILLRIIKQYPGIAISELLIIANNSTLRGGGLPIKDGYKLALHSKLIRLEDNIVYTTDMGFKIVSAWDKEEPNLDVYRKILLQLLIKIMPAWIPFCHKPIQERQIAIPESWKELLINGELYDAPLTSEGKKWWTKLQKQVNEFEKVLAKDIGKVGEILTINYEKERLIKSQYPDLAEDIIWMSEDIGDHIGYDIESYFGDFLKSAFKNNDKLRIEVKSSTFDSKTSFIFHFSRNQWETAKLNFNNYYLFLWRSAKKEKERLSGEGPLILPSEILRDYVPQDQRKEGKWESCRIVLKYNEINTHLTDPNGILNN